MNESLYWLCALLYALYVKLSCVAHTKAEHEKYSKVMRLAWRVHDAWYVCLDIMPVEDRYTVVRMANPIIKNYSVVGICHRINMHKKFYLVAMVMPEINIPELIDCVREESHV